MTNKTRVQASLNHIQPDAVPVDFGSTSVTGMHVNCVAALREFYGLEKRPVKVHEPYQMLGLVEPDLQDALGLDVDGVFPPETMFGFRNENWRPWTLHNGLELLVSEHFKVKTDDNGDFLIFPKGDTSAKPSGKMPKTGFFFDSIIRQYPVDDNNLNPDDNLEEFSPISDDSLVYFADEAQRASLTGRAVMANFGGTAFGDIALVPAPFLKDPKGIRDIEEWYISTLTRQDYIHQVFEKQCDIALANLAKIFSVVGNQVDAVFLCGTDFGTQNSTFCSKETFRSLYMPYYQRINDWIHKHTTWKTFKHSCGSVITLLPDLIDSGFDILNPVQCSAAGMNAQDLKNEFGQDLVFWGGGVDTQRTLPFGTPEEVRKEVLQRCEIFSRDGGFVFNSIHNVQANTPPENIIAMFQAIKEFNGNM
ncbi:MAG TPA: uroporphyrinogen decarboxylase family protein [bacterium]|nr:uroporphyrinogen decarboxylase family protein [bacterium]HPN43780.1 uroporphyrinogen decarboxylase family protein [bacterium]